MRIFSILIFLLPLLVSGQENLLTSRSSKELEHYLHAYSRVDDAVKSVADISGFIKKLERKKLQKKHAEFIRFLFSKTHQQFLKDYNESTSFSEMLNRGMYNCLTGTALYAVLLDHFDIEYKVIETNYHIFLLAFTDEGTILLEATDPLNGFVDSPQDIEYRINQYKENRIQEVATNKEYHRYNLDLYNQVTLDQMEGLLHYNQSIKAYNQQNFQSSIYHLGKASEHYRSPRIVEFSTLMLQAVMKSNLDDQVKEDYIRKIQAICKQHVPVMASLSAIN